MDGFITEDGSKTYRNPVIDELYHTKAGAIVEALEKHARALRVWEKENPVIFDVCSGLSYSAACALEEIRDHGNDSLVTIYLFENDRAILEKNLELPDTIEYKQNGVKKRITCYKHFKVAISKYLEHNSEHNKNHNAKLYQSDNLRIIIMFGDVNLQIDKVEQSADYIFYAPFSPMFTPNMWTYDIFRKLYMHTSSGGKLSTYSYAKKVRDALSEAGFKVENGPTLGRRSPSLIGVNDQ
jgi:tRNA U34 5-methylaminomethyl-2-thiouridine-forming methyltransferase MnmC